MTESLIHDLLIILSAGLLASLVCRWLHASVLIGYLVVGGLLGQGVLGWVTDQNHQLEHFAEAGVFLLLFSIGLEFSLDDLKRLGRNLAIGGSVQMFLVAVPVGIVMYAYQFSWQASILIGSAASFSSTVLVFKSLSEWGQTQQPHGRRAIGILLFQDAALIPLLLMVPLLTGAQSETVNVITYGLLALTSLLFVLAVLGLRTLLAQWVIPRLAGYRSPELVILFTLVSLGAVTLAAYSVGLPPAVGAFAAGLIFNGNRWTKQIDALVLPFREIFAAVFFVVLGLIFDPRLIWNDPILMGSALVSLILLKAIAATIALRLTGLSLSRAFGMGIGLAHIGEFAFVLCLLGAESGVISKLAYQQIVAIAVGSLVLTPPLMKMGLRFFKDETNAEESVSIDKKEIDSNRAVVIGAGPIGRRIASQLETIGKDVCLVDLSPINLHSFAQEGFRTVAGDASDPEILKLAEAASSSLTVVCVPSDEVALQIVRVATTLNSRGKLVVRCRYQSSAPKLAAAGADHVVIEETEATLALLDALRKLEI